MGRYEISRDKRKLWENSLIPFAIYQFVDRRVVTLVLSDGFLKLFNYTDRDKAYYDMDHDMYKDTDPEDAARIADAAYRFATEGGRYDVIYRSKGSDGKEYTIIHAIGEHFITDDGTQLAQVWYMDEGSYSGDDKDSGLTKSLKKAIRRESMIKASYYDHLTGLPSMTYFFELAEAGCKAIVDGGDTPAFLFLDLSGMKNFNHKHGFTEGDKLLRSFSRLLTDHFSNENCSRFGQDHFAVFTDENGVDEKLHDIFRKWQCAGGSKSLPVRVGVYIARYDKFDKFDISTACDNAKAACDTLRNTYVSSISYYNKELEDNLDKKDYIISNLDKALKEKWISVYYQPIVRAVNGRVCDEEALARWIDPVRGFMSPADFIQVLEEAHLIYKLDLYMVDQIIEKLKIIEEEGLHKVPQSVNLSRTDFDECDIVSEICTRMDAAGLSHSLLTIEITESIVGTNFEFMKKQVDRFRRLGFRVWMDDFGSGYSSLDVLQDLEFDLIKFDMRFLQQMDKNNNSRVILTELMRMATKLGLETVCEGVETIEHVNFLKEVGCCKLQGYYFTKPIPIDQILNRYRTGIQIGFEDPREADYYDDLGKLNLYDLDWVTGGGNTDLDKYFTTIPMVIMELNETAVRIVRANASYREFSDRMLARNIGEEYEDFDTIPEHHRNEFLKPMIECARTGRGQLVDERFPNNITVHTIMRRVALNPVKNTVSVAVAILSVTDDSKGVSYASIAKSLAADYFNLFYVNIETEEYIEYDSKVGDQELTVKRTGSDFFAQSRKEALEKIHKSDRKTFISTFTRDKVLKALDEQGTFTLTYRRLMKGKSVYVNMKVMRMSRIDNYLIVAISNINTQKRQMAILEKIKREHQMYSRVSALAGDYICMYTVDPETNKYIEYSVSRDYEKLGMDKEGEDFFGQALRDGADVICKDDLPMYYKTFTRENVINTIKSKGVFMMKYRLMIDGEPVRVFLRATIVKESDGDKIIVGVKYEDTSKNIS
ncbi:MAG: EAL domain-containing protein [Lachnospiraceae bacterium]|nr:EAL domain-containing protein [Lachnospiraceae bacterium]